MSFDPICIDCMGGNISVTPHKAITIVNGCAVCEDHAYSRWRRREVRHAEDERLLRHAPTPLDPFDA